MQSVIQELKETRNVIELMTGEVLELIKEAKFYMLSSSMAGRRVLAATEVLEKGVLFKEIKFQKLLSIGTQQYEYQVGGYGCYERGMLDYNIERGHIELTADSEEALQFLKGLTV